MQRLSYDELVDRLEHRRDELVDDPVIVVEAAGPAPIGPAALEARWSACRPWSSRPASTVDHGVADAHGRGRGPTPPRSGASSKRSSSIRKPPCRSRCCCVVGVDRSVVDGLIAESTTYSMLQAGPDHRQMAGQPAGPSPPRADADEVVLLRRDGDHLSITLNRPDTRNTFDAPMRDALLEAFALLAADVSLTATLDANGPSFCSGGDLREFGTIADPATAHLVRVRRNVGRTLAEVADRVTVRVRGHCVGAGVELPAFATQVIAEADATFCLPEISMGLIPGAGGTVSIPNRIGRQRTMRLALSAEPIDAATALGWGLVDEIVDR